MGFIRFTYFDNIENCLTIASLPTTRYADPTQCVRLYRLDFGMAMSLVRRILWQK